MQTRDDECQLAAVNAFTEGLRLRPGNPHDALQKVTTAIQQNKNISIHSRTIQHDLLLFRYQVCCGSLLLSIGLASEDSQLLQRSIEENQLALNSISHLKKENLEDDKAALLHDQAFAYYKLGELKQAISHYQRAIALANNPPSHFSEIAVSAYYGLGLCYNVIKNYDEALKHFATVKFWSYQHNYDAFVVKVHSAAAYAHLKNGFWKNALVEFKFFLEKLLLIGTKDLSVFQSYLDSAFVRGVISSLFTTVSSELEKNTDENLWRLLAETCGLYASVNEHLMDSDKTREFCQKTLSTLEKIPATKQITSDLNLAATYKDKLLKVLNQSIPYGKAEPKTSNVPRKDKRVTFSDKLHSKSKHTTTHSSKKPKQHHEFFKQPAEEAQLVTRQHAHK